MNDPSTSARNVANRNLKTDTSSLLTFVMNRPVRHIRQSESAECGLACIAMIADYHGSGTDLASLRQRFPQSVHGTSLSKLLDVAHALGLTGRALRFDLDEISNLNLPCLLHWGLDHYVVLRRIEKNRVIISDPAHGQRSIDLAELGRQATGVALELSKGPTFQRAKAPPPVSIRKLAGSIRGITRALATIFSLAFLLEVFALLWPQLMQVITDQVLADGDHDLLSFIGISFFALLAIQTAVAALRTWTMTWLSTTFQLQWGANVFQHLLRLPQPYFLRRHLGDIVSKYGSVSTIQETITADFVAVVLDGMMALATLVMMFIYSVPMAVVCVTALVMYLAIRALYYRYYFESNLSQVRESAKQQSVFIESIRGVQTLRINNKIADQTSRFVNASTDTLNTSIAVQRLNLVFGSISGFISGAQRVGVLWLGAWIALQGKLSVGMLMAFAAYAEQFASRGTALVDSIIHLRLLGMQAERLADIVLHPTEGHVEGDWTGPEPEPKIQFSNVSFRYSESDPWILKNCSFQVAVGESLAITGPSGCGKSTIARLLLGLLDPVAGSISVGGIDVRRLGKQRLRAMTAGVIQDDTLFSGTIAQNIAFFDENADIDGVCIVSRMAGIHDDIMKMPMGYRSMIGDMGSSLSGGQTQRILLARALYRRPAILVLDEATSHLDPARERQINETVAALRMTKIIIAHRAETIASADRMLDLAI
jgi:ATP-binding cassette subfamily B protein RaxB